MAKSAKRSSAASALKSLRIVGAAWLVSLTASNEARALGWDDEKTLRLDRLVALYCLPCSSRKGKSRAPSLAVSVGIDGAIALAKGYGDAAPGVPASSRTLYRIGSITKSMTAAAILTAIEEKTNFTTAHGALSLETPLSQLFGSIDHWQVKGRGPVTLANLLTMTSNLPNFTRVPPQTLNPFKAVASQDLLGQLKLFKPRPVSYGFEYSNTNYFMLSAALETVTGREYPGAMKQLVSEPVGMTETVFDGQSTKPNTERAVPTYTRRPAFVTGAWLNGSADVSSTAEDLFAWNKAVMEGPVPSRSVRDRMFAPAARVSPRIWYGMGWFIETTNEPGRIEYYHSGTIPGFTAFNTIIKLRSGAHWISITLLTNRGDVEGLETLAGEIENIARE